MDDIQQQQMIRATERLRLEARLRSGADWFFWIAGLSVVNSVLGFLDVSLNFVAGLGMTQLIDGISFGIASQLDPTVGTIIRVVSFVFNLIIVGLVALLGVLAR